MDKKARKQNKIEAPWLQTLPTIPTYSYLFLVTLGVMGVGRIMGLEKYHNFGILSYCFKSVFGETSYVSSVH